MGSTVGARCFMKHLEQLDVNGELTDIDRSHWQCYFTNTPCYDVVFCAYDLLSGYVYCLI